jgi:hypothetical protein
MFCDPAKYLRGTEKKRRTEFEKVSKRLETRFCHLQKYNSNINSSMVGFVKSTSPFEYKSAKLNFLHKFENIKQIKFLVCDTSSEV